MKCCKCGEEIECNVKFCSYCGNQINLESNAFTSNNTIKTKNVFIVATIIIIIVATIGFVKNENNGMDKNNIATDVTSSNDSKQTTSIKINIPIQWDSTKITNCFSSGGMAIEGEKNYFVNRQGLYTATKGESVLKKINYAPDNMSDLFIIDDKLYYSNNNGICVFDTKKQKETILSYIHPRSMTIYKDYIYYTLDDESLDSPYYYCHIYKMSLDGKINTCIKENIIDDSCPLVIYNDFLYFVDSENQNLNKMTLGGQQTDVLIQGEICDLFNIHIENGYIYYCRVIEDTGWSSECRLYRAKLDGTDETQITSVDTNDFYVYNDKIYYEEDNVGDKTSLHVINTDGTNDLMIEEKIYEGYVDFSVVDDWLIYMSATDYKVGDNVYTSFQPHYLDIKTNKINTLEGI